MTSRGTWKRAERLAARFYGTERLPGSGAWRRITESDTMHERLYIEVKLREHWPKTGVWPIFRDAAEKAKKESKVPVVVMREKGSPLVLHVVAEGDIDTLVVEREGSKNRAEPPPKGQSDE